MKLFRVLSILGLALLLAGGALGQTVRLHECVKRSPGNAQVLQAALERSLAGRGSVESLGEGAPCDHTGALLRDLKQLADARSFLGLRNHTFASSETTATCSTSSNSNCAAKPTPSARPAG
jgi:hypothetical protein